MYICILMQKNMKKLIIVIDCNDVNKEDFYNFQKHLFTNKYQWHSSKYDGQEKYKNSANLLIIEDKEMFNGQESVLKDVSKEADIKRFNSPVEYTRYYKIKHLKTKFK